MLGYALVREPTVTLRVSSSSFNVNAWICACQTTDRDLETKKGECLDTCQVPFFNYNCNVCNVCNVCNLDADLLFSIYYKSVTSVICYSPKVFDFISDLYL